MAALAGVVAIAAAATAIVAIASGAGTAPARATAERCEGAAALDFRCFQRRLVGLTRSRGAEEALRDLALQRARNGYVRATCHQLTHRIGRAAGAIRGISAFTDGEPLCSSGYYHGVVEAVMAKIGAARVVERARTVCAALRERDRHSADHYNCAHGMGHGFMGAFRGDVDASLAGCDALGEPWERRNCHGGVFMENLSALDNPTRPTVLRPDRPLYPCTAVAPRYQEPCFDKQTTYALFVTDGDFAAVFDLCSAVRAPMRGACERGLGGDVAVHTVKQVLGGQERTAARRQLCLLARDGSARANCVVGAVRVILRDLAGGAAQAADLCRAFSARLRRVCLAARAEAYRELPLQPGT